jgi:hypothetical protein
MCVVVGSKIPNMKENKNHPIRKKRKLRGLDIDDLLGLLGIGEFFFGGGAGVGGTNFVVSRTKTFGNFLDNCVF